MKVQNLHRLKQRIAALPEETRKEIQSALLKSGNEIADAARRFVPKRSGALRDSIGVTLGDHAPENANVRGVSAGGGGHDLAVTIHAGNAKAFYAAWVEFGTKPHSVARGGGTKGGQKKARAGGGIPHPGAAPSPFFFPAYRLNKKRAKSRIARAIGKAARKVAAG